jgi:rubrerythrin
MEQLLEILETAIRAEVDAKRLYLKGAERASNPEAKALFTRLAEEEDSHRVCLIDLYEQIVGRTWSEWASP